MSWMRGRYGTICVCASSALVVTGCCVERTASTCPAPVADSYRRPEPIPSTAPLAAPRQYAAPFAANAIALDGKLDEGAWASAPWSDDFVDIEGTARRPPAQHTRVKMLWDATNLYIGADLAETDLWATLTEHDDIVYRDNDFEVFVDPDGDTREYYEIEVNAIGTIFDLYLPVPYRAGAKANHDWNATGMRVAIQLDGTVNDSRDTDRGWQIEIAIPWTVFTPVSDSPPAPTYQCTARPPNTGDCWRINFSRVQWTLEKQGISYAKVAGKPEENWTWTPQWIIDMHVPQWWGVVTFAPPADQTKESFK